eukprot:scaffold51428_cov63-Phaeocystis_antarctica.AAC.1
MCANGRAVMQAPGKPPRAVPSCLIDPRGCACYRSCHPRRLPCPCVALLGTEMGTATRRRLWRQRCSLPDWEERRGLKHALSRAWTVVMCMS